MRTPQRIAHAHRACGEGSGRVGSGLVWSARCVWCVVAVAIDDVIDALHVHVRRGLGGC
jgi:hypothetical protein